MVSFRAAALHRRQPARLDGKAGKHEQQEGQQDGVRLPAVVLAVAEHHGAQGLLWARQQRGPGNTVKLSGGQPGVWEAQVRAREEGLCVLCTNPSVPLSEAEKDTEQKVHRVDSMFHLRHPALSIPLCILRWPCKRPADADYVHGHPA